MLRYVHTLPEMKRLCWYRDGVVRTFRDDALSNPTDNRAFQCSTTEVIVVPEHNLVNIASCADL